MFRKILLVCGILSPVLYAISDLVAGMQWEGYSFRDQTISELGAIDAPSRPLFAVLLLLVYGLMVAFGVGIRKAASGNRRLRIVGSLFIAVGVMALTVGQFVPMRLRGTEQGLVGTLHLVEGAGAMLMIFSAMAIAACTFGKRFRLYTIGTIILAVGFGAWAVSEFKQIEQGLSTPWIGLKERIFWYGYQTWFIVLALTLLRGQRAARAESGGLHVKERLSASRSPFKTPEGEAAFLAAHEAALKLWPVPYEERDVQTRFGMTHVVISGPKEAPPLVLLHGYMATLMMWAPNIADFSKEYRVYAVDVMGQPSRSIPGEPIRDRTDFEAWLTATLDGLHLGRVSLVGMSFGGWIALGYGVAKPERIEKLVLLSVGGFLPMAKQFTMRGMLMVFWPTRLTVTSFMHWLGVKENPADPATHGMDNLVELTYLGLKHFRMPQETARVMPTVFSDGELRSMRMPTLVLFGDHEVICDPAAALSRALQLIPDCRGELVPGPWHDMCATQYRLVDARVLDFLKKTRPENQTGKRQRSIA
jgi:pimeloyl-ACP methyl ester carboxylesterase/hypothetical membrane protein